MIKFTKRCAFAISDLGKVFGTRLTSQLKKHFIKSIIKECLLEEDGSKVREAGLWAKEILADIGIKV